MPAGYLVLGGLLILGALIVRFRRQPPPGVVEVGGLYWHFVDLVWLSIFTSVFIPQ